VIGSRRAYRRPYFFEIFVAANVVFVYAIILLRGPDVIALTNINVLIALVTLIAQCALGVMIRAAVEAARGRGRRFFRVIRSKGWWTDSLRLVVAGALVIGVYGIVKLMIPLYHPVLYDKQLWDLEQRMFGGYAPVVVVLNLFSAPRVMSFFDSAYARIFFTSLFIGPAFFLSHPSRRIRLAFANGNAVLWIAGAWLYLLIPSLGPAYAFPELWIPIRELMPVTNAFHASLMQNYQNVLRLRGGSEPQAINFMFGIAAFPSLHVGFQTFVFVWMRRVWLSGQVLFGLFTLVIFIGSMVTGWHYLIDGLAGIALAVACYVGAAKPARVGEWFRLWSVIRR